jgi:hypothetical protein
MHRLHSKSALNSFRLGTVLLGLFGLAIIAAIVLGAAGLLTGRSELLQWFLIAVVTAPLVGLLYLTYGHRARCPLCMNPPLVPRGCQKHRNAMRLFGSHRLTVALSIFTRGKFVCPHCGEATALKLRDRNRPR